MILKRCFLSGIVVFAVSLLSFGQQGGNKEIAVAFYNCENFFDIIDNPAKNDDDFTPTGKYRYTLKIYEQKLHNIATVLQTMTGKDGPAIIGMAEVENSTVLRDLLRQPEIARRAYKYVWYDGPDARGINVALIYRPSQFKLIKSEPLHVNIAGTGGKATTRDVLYVTGLLGGDTVHILVNHWPSRRGGEEASEGKRAIAAQVNKDAADKILKKRPGAKILIMGDMNDNPDDKSITQILGAKTDQRQTTATGFFNPWAAYYSKGMGTEVYRRKWNLFDQILVSGGWLQGNKGQLKYVRAEIYKPEFITDHYKGHEGEPKRSFANTRWINGYSDHFPVLIYLAK